MENTLRFYHTLVHVLNQHRNWLDLRYLKGLGWMPVPVLGVMEPYHLDTLRL